MTTESQPLYQSNLTESVQYLNIKTSLLNHNHSIKVILQIINLNINEGLLNYNHCIKVTLQILYLNINTGTL